MLIAVMRLSSFSSVLVNSSNLLISSIFTLSIMSFFFIPSDCSTPRTLYVSLSSGSMVFILSCKTGNLSPFIIFPLSKTMLLCHGWPVQSFHLSFQSLMVFLMDFQVIYKQAMCTLLVFFLQVFPFYILLCF